jgi:hypothetical protein
VAEFPLCVNFFSSKNGYGTMLGMSLCTYVDAFKLIYEMSLWLILTSCACGGTAILKSGKIGSCIGVFSKAIA